MTRQRSNVFSIAPGVPFLSTLVDALKDGKLIADFDIQDPLNLSRCTFYVPTQRAARSLRATLIEKSGTNACLLPSIYPIGALGEEMAGEQDFALSSGALALTLPPPIDRLERILLLARLIRPWRERLPQHLRQLFGHEQIAIPTNSADAIWLAHDLARLMDEVDTQEADWSNLSQICPDDVAEWWQVTLDFLHIIIDTWPQISNQHHFSNPAIWRNQMIRARTDLLKQQSQAGPVIAAGSTGSIPATADLLRVIATLPQGAVILPGLDRDMDEASWQSLDHGEETHLTPFTHPQYGLKNLLKSLRLAREDVIHLGKASAELRQREYYISAALRPADTTDLWAKMDLSHDDLGRAFENVILTQAASEREEALSIAIILRQAIEEENIHAALVTSDRTLARRVSAELKRFGIRVDDSSGRPLLETEPVALLRLLLDGVFYPGDVVSFLSLLKHPLTRLGMERQQLRYFVERLELFALRGGTGRIDLNKTPQFIASRLLQFTESNSDDFAKVDPQWVEIANQLGAAIGEAVHPLTALRDRTDEITTEQAMIATITCFENFGRDENGQLHDLYAQEAGQALSDVFTRLLSEQSGITFFPAEWPEMFKALIKDEVVRMAPFSHPRLAIWGGLEARMQPVDVMVLGGLNEGVWPQAARGCPFMSRAMKATLGLDPPERRIGLAAHDFQMAMGAKKVILSRSLRASNAPCVASRWLQRLLAICGEEQTTTMRQRGEKYLHWARNLEVGENVPFAPRPCPSPPLAARPKHFSVTEVDILRRDPYAIYARRILRLRVLPPLIRDPDVAERGQLYHAIVASFAWAMEEIGSTNLPPDDALRIVRSEFDRLQLPIDVEAIWWPRFQLLLPQILHCEQQAGPRRRYPETISRRVDINDSGFTLSGRADRIDILPSKMAEILDFKTGSTPNLAQARSLAAPQLALEGALLRRGGFVEIGQCQLSDFLYIRLGSQGEVKWERLGGAGHKTAVELAEEAWEKLDALVRLYAQENHGFLSHALPRLGHYEGEYDHLARLLEWSAGGEEAGGEDG